MKYHAILIQTHAHLDLLKLLIEHLSAKNFYFFIHVDKKTRNFDEFRQIESPHVHFSSKRYNVFWGAEQQIYLTIDLIKMAVSSGINFDFYHLISGQDFPIRNPSQFDTFFKNSDKSYMELDNRSYIQNRFMLYHFNSLINPRNKWGRRFECYGIKLQKRIPKWINLRTKLKLQPFKGSNWWSLNKEAIKYILIFLEKEPTYLKRFKHTSCCDEVFFHTILFNSPLNDTIELTDLRYVDWNKKYTNEPLPRTLTENDYLAITQSNCIFMRKVDYSKSKKLINKILNINFVTE